MTFINNKLTTSLAFSIRSSVPQFPGRSLGSHAHRPLPTLTAPLVASPPHSRGQTPRCPSHGLPGSIPLTGGSTPVESG